MSIGTLWLLLIFGYIVTVLVEIPILIVGFQRKYTIAETIVNGLLLTAITYPVVIMVLPAMFTEMRIESRALYLAVAESFAPITEVLFFRYLTDRPLAGRLDRDAAVIVIANLTSFLLGEAGLSQWIGTTVKNL
jgi:hypothetical protein